MIASMDYRYALNFYRRATWIADHVKGLDPSGVFTLYANRAGVHALVLEPDSALYFLRKAIIVSKEDSHDAEVSAYNNLGVFYLGKMQYDSAAMYFNRALDLMGNRKEKMGLYCAIRDNLAQLDVIHHRFQPALATFIFNDSVYTARKLHNKYLANKLRQVNVMMLADLPGVDEELQKGLAHLRTHSVDVPVRDATALFRLAVEYYQTHGFPDNAMAVLNYSYHWTDSLQAANAEQLHFLNTTLLQVQEASFQNVLQVKQLEADKANLGLRAARRLTWISIVSGMAILAILFLYFQMRRHQLLAKNKIAEAELRNKHIASQLMEHELNLKKKDLTNLVLHNTQVHDANQKMIERLQSISKSKEDFEVQIRHVLHELQGQNQIGERALAIQDEIETVNAAFYEKLKSRFPNLTKAEEELCGFLRINMTTKDISVLKNVEAASVKMAKNRLRKKLNIGPEVDLYGFVKEV